MRLTYKTAFLVILLVLFSIFLITTTTLAQTPPCGGANARCCQTTPKCTASGYTCNNIANPPNYPYGRCVTNSTPPSPPPGGGGIQLTNPLVGVSDIQSFLERLMNILRDFATPIAVLMVLVGAFQMLVSAGDPAKFQAGQKTILYSAIGYAIIFLGWGITSIIQSLLSP